MFAVIRFLLINVFLCHTVHRFSIGKDNHDVALTGMNFTYLCSRIFLSVRLRYLIHVHAVANPGGGPGGLGPPPRNA